MSRSRFIPARAGNTIGRYGRVGLHSVHPRTSGEHIVRGLHHLPGLGSSPHERGTQGFSFLVADLHRFIPARAGNTSQGRRKVQRRPVHPRTSGEHRCTKSPLTPMRGSSPHERGTLGSPLLERGLDRFIPARAGNTPQFARIKSSSSVHPRTSGEHYDCRKKSQEKYGSSPHERGTQTGRERTHEQSRFIPARAGNTYGGVGRDHAGTVHPRTSGEHYQVEASAGALRGSSPHERGTPRCVGEEFLDHRFIPARAGNTLDMCNVALPQEGSSPHERGTRGARQGSGRLIRFIPARAGNTLKGEQV